jgi:hypothetical protein
MKKWGFKVLVGVLFVTLAFGGMAMAQTTKQAKEPAKAAAKKAVDMAIIVVDLQGDFTKAKKGSLAVEGTDDAYVWTRNSSKPRSRRGWTRSMTATPVSRMTAGKRPAWTRS